MTIKVGRLVALVEQLGALVSWGQGCWLEQAYITPVGGSAARPPGGWRSCFVLGYLERRDSVSLVIGE